MKCLRVVMLILNALCFIVIVQIHGVAGPPPAFLPGQQGPPDAPPPTSPPSEPIILHSTPQRLPPDFEGPPQQTPSPRRRLNAAATRKDAAQLAALASKIPDEVEQVSKGVLPKDLDHQLKEIQKLAKRLRGEVTP